MDPLAKMAVESGKEATVGILNRLEYLASLTIPRELSWLGINRAITPMDKQTFYFIRDHPVFSAVRRLADHGVAHQYGEVLLEGGHAPESLVASASAIALVQESEAGDIQIYRKKQFGLEDKHGKDLIPEFYNVTSKEKDKKHEPEAIKEYDVEALEVKKPEVLPPLKKDDKTPPLKIRAVVEVDDSAPWEE